MTPTPVTVTASAVVGAVAALFAALGWIVWRLNRETGW